MKNMGPAWHYKENCRVAIVYPVRTAASHAAKSGSNPLGDAKFDMKKVSVESTEAFFVG